MRGDGGVAGEGRVVGVPKFHSWGKCNMILTNIKSDWMSKASSACVIYWAIYIIYIIYIIYAGSLSCILGCNDFLQLTLVKCPLNILSSNNNTTDS